MNIFINRMWLFIVLIFNINNCSSGLNSSNSVDNNNTSKLSNESTSKISIDFCSKLKGNWDVYRNKKGKGKDICGDHPCGDKMPEFVLDCVGNEIVGKILTGTSTVGEKPQTFWADITSFQKDEKITLQFKHNCLFSFKILEIEGNKLFGEFLAENCSKPDWLPYHEGDFTAVRVTNSPK